MIALNIFFAQAARKILGSAFSKYERTDLKLFLSMAFVIILSVALPPRSNAQAVTWTQTDIGGTGATGTYSYSSGTYTIAGAGTGIGGTADSFSYVSTPTTGNIEMIAKVTSQTNTNNYAVSGLMMRDSLNANGAGAVIGVSPANGVNFTFRTTDGATSTTMLGPSIAAPVWLRLVHSGSSFAGYQSSDGISWTLVGSSNQITMPSSYYVGFAVSSNSYGNLSTAVFNSVAYMTSVPQRSANLITWLRADAGVTYSSGQVSQWTDQSGNGNNANQTVSADQPTLTTGALNGLPALSFNGTSQFLQFGSGFANFTSGASIFVVVNPTSLGSYQTWIEFGNSSTNYLGFEEGSTSGTVYYYVYNGSSGSNVAATSSLTAGQYQLMESVYNGSNTGTVYNNGVQKATSTSLLTAPNATRSNNYVGQFGGSTAYYHGQIAEILVYNTALTASQRASVESYIYSKYSIGNQPTLDTPTISPGYGVFSTSPQQVTITADAGAQIYYTTNGATPTSSSTLYTGPFNITTSTTVKAIAIEPFFTNSAVASAYLQIDPTTANLPLTNLITWLKADNGVLTSGSNVTQWTDMSSTANNAVQSNGSYQPTLVTNAVNGLPAISFNGSNEYLQFGSGFANFTAGASIFLVVNPAALSGYQTWFSVSDSGGSNYLGFEEGSTAGSVASFVYNSTTSSSVIASSAITASQYQLMETVYNGSNTATIYGNGTQLAQSTSMQTAPNTTRTNNYLGQLGTGSYFHGQIAEVLVYNTALSASQRAAVEGYLRARYALSVNPPSFSEATGIYASGQTVSMTADPGAQIYYTTNGSTPTIGSTPYTAPITVNTATTIKAIAVQSFGTSSVSSVTIQIDPNSAAIPRTGLQVWLRSDVGVVTSGSNVSQWTDVSGNNNNATQGTSSYQPTVVANAVNELPALAMSASKYLVLPSGFSNLNSAGADMFIVVEPTASVNYTSFVYIGNSSSTDGLTIEQDPAPNGISLFVSNGTTASRVTASSISPLNVWQSLEGSLSSGTSPTGSVYYNSALAATGTSEYLNGVVRSENVVGTFSGQIAEVLLYNAPLTATQRAAVQAYLAQRYQLSLQTPTAPIISVAGGTLAGPTQVAIAAQSGASIYYTTDGTTPTTSSNLYSGPINVYYSLTLKAIAVTNGVSSTVTSNTYTLNSTQWPAPATGGPSLQINLQLPTNAVPQ